MIFLAFTRGNIQYDIFIFMSFKLSWFFSRYFFVDNSWTFFSFLYEPNQQNFKVQQRNQKSEIFLRNPNNFKDAQSSPNLTFIYYFVPARSLHETCVYDQQCRSYDSASVCVKLVDEDESVCICKPGYYEDKEHNIPIKFRCFLGQPSRFWHASLYCIWLKEISLAFQFQSTIDTYVYCSHWW